MSAPPVLNDALARLSPEGRRLLDLLVDPQGRRLRDMTLEDLRTRPPLPALMPVRALEGTRRRPLPDTLSGTLTQPVAGEAPALVVYLHGGGWCLGHPDRTEGFQRLLAVDSGLDVAALRYPLAPESPFPAPVEACEAALDIIAREVARDRPIVLLGDSAGGNLAIACARRGARVAALALVYPVADCDLGRDSYRRFGTNDFALSTDDMLWFWERYVPKAEDRLHPDASPLRATDLVALPPTLLYLAECDALRDEGAALGQALARTGVLARVHETPGQIHGFATQAGVTPDAEAFVAMLARDIRATLGLDAARPSRATA